MFSYEIKSSISLEPAPRKNLMVLWMKIQKSNRNLHQMHEIFINFHWPLSRIVISFQVASKILDLLPYKCQGFPNATWCDQFFQQTISQKRVMYHLRSRRPIHWQKLEIDWILAFYQSPFMSFVSNICLS